MAGPDSSGDDLPCDGMTPFTPDIRPYLEIRTSAPSGWSPDARHLLVSSDLPGTAQVHRLDLDEADALPVSAEDLEPITAFEEPVGAAYLPDDPTGEGRMRLLVVTDRGGNERHQLYTAPHRPDAAYRSHGELEPLVVDDEHIHTPGGATRDGRLLAYATNRGDGVAFDCWVRDLVDGTERRVYASGSWTAPGGFSPDGRRLAVSELTTRAGDNRVLLVDLDRLSGAEVAARSRDPELAGPDDPVVVDGAAAGPDDPVVVDGAAAGPDDPVVVDGAAAGPDDPAVVELSPHPDAPAAVGTPSWLPDAERFFFATDVGREHVGIARGTADGAWEYVIEPGWDAGVAVDWSGRQLLVAWNEDGLTRAQLRDPDSLEVRTEVPLPGDGVAGGFRFTRDGRSLAFSFSSPRVPGDVWRYDTVGGALDRLTVSPCGLDAAGFVDAELARFRSFDGLDVPLFVYRPRTARGPVPVVVVLHGGPESQYRPSFKPLTQYLVAQGFAVVAPNVRGSTGYGRTYQHLDDVDKRFDAIRDLASLHDWLAAQPDLDEERAALYGGSYGGYLVLAGLAFQPERWAAGVGLVGMSNLVTFLENTSVWRRAFREREYGSLEHDRALLEDLSPINYVEQMRAPLFLVHGANDPRVPLSEAEQIHAVLGERGIRSELRVYDDEGHGLSKLTNRIDAYPRVAAFLHEILDG
jgi:dipeptidyl aminopeptidase/acylaminoacyl peptidase